jgi:hypothetical protein
MRTKILRLDLDKTAANWPTDEPFAPAVVLPKRGDPTRFFVLDAPFEINSAPVWADNLRDRYLRIPLFKYRFPFEVDAAFARVFEIAFACASALAFPVETLYLVTGFPVDLIDGADNNIDAHYLDYWFGLALSLKDKT